jgi:uncharacterized Tic20 family protein
MSDNQNQTPPAIQPPSSNAPATPPPNAESQARMWNMLCHLGGLIPCIPCLVTLLIWQLKKSEFPSVEVHGKAALNFQITVLLVFIAGMIASVVLSVIHLGWLISLLFPLIGLASLVLMIIAGIKANNGEDYKYPWSLELVK